MGGRHAARQRRPAARAAVLWSRTHVGTHIAFSYVSVSSGDCGRPRSASFAAQKFGDLAAVSAGSSSAMPELPEVEDARQVRDLGAGRRVRALWQRRPSRGRADYVLLHHASTTACAPPPTPCPAPPRSQDLDDFLRGKTVATVTPSSDESAWGLLSGCCRTAALRCAGCPVRCAAPPDLRRGATGLQRACAHANALRSRQRTAQTHCAPRHRGAGGLAAGRIQAGAGGAHGGQGAV